MPRPLKSLSRSLVKKLLCLLVLCLLYFTETSAQLGFGTTRRADNNFSQFLTLKNVEANTQNPAGGPQISAFNNTPNTVGRRFFSDSWMGGDSIIDASQKMFSGDSIFFNFDMMAGRLIASPDKRSITAVDPGAIRSFILIDKASGKRHNFKQLPKTWSAFYCEQLVLSNTGLSLYKRSSARFKEADFRSDGLTQQGSREDTYTENSSYCLYDDKTGEINILPSKHKQIRQLPLLQGNERVGTFMQQHKHQRVDENFLIELVRFMNGEK